MKYLIIGDSSTNLSKEECQTYHTKIAPLSIMIDDKEYIDNETLNLDDFLKHLSTTKSVAKSSCPSSHAYMDLFEEDCDMTFIVTLSGKLSGSYNSAVLAANLYREYHPDARIHVFDSKSAASSQYLLVRKIHELAEAGLSFEEIVAEGEKYRDEMQLLFVLDDLSNLEKNGRLSALQATIAKMLNLKLILSQDKNGEIGFAHKARGTKKTLAKLVATMKDYKKIASDTRIAVFHCAALEKAMALKESIESMYGEISDIRIVQMFGLNSTYAQVGGIIITF